MSIERPIFIIGAQRSGTTLLRYILSSHQRIYIPPESNFIPRYFYDNPTNPISREQAVEIVAGILRYRTFFKDWPFDRPEAEELVNSLPTLTAQNIIQILYSQYAAHYGAARWGDKSPIYSDHVDLIHNIFPHAQFVHIIRDGRDVALSMLSSYRGTRFFYIDVYYAAKVWKQRVISARRSGQRLGRKHYYELHYEHLTANPEEEIKKLCDYLDEEFHPVMMEPQSAANKFHHSHGIHANTRKPLNTTSVGKWNKSMSGQNQRLFQSIAGDLLFDLGYELRDLGKQSIIELMRSVGLRTKFRIIQFGKQATKSAGVFHPTDILSRYLEPYPNKGNQ